MKVSGPIPKSVAAQAQPPDPGDIKLRKVCREFESLLVAQMLTKMRSTVPKADLFGSSEKEEFFQDLLDQEIAKQVSQAGTMKIGDLLYIQLSKANKNR